MTAGGVEIEWKVSLGQLITIASVIAGIAISWSNLDGRVTANEKATLDVKAAALERDVRQDQDIAELIKDRNAMAIVLEGIRVDVGYLRRNVEETKRTATGQ